MLKDSDQIWLDGERKLRGIFREIRALIADGSDILLLAHFETPLNEIHAALRAESIEFRPYTSFDDPTLFRPASDGRAHVRAGLARNFHPRAATTREEAGGRALSIIVAEHHPLPVRDQAIIDAAQNLPRETRICFHAALTDALLVYFGAEQITRWYKQLGADEESSLSHHLIDTAIRSAQENVAQRVVNEMPTSSAEDWFKYNLL